MERTPPELKANARRLRRDATTAERALWNAFRSHRPRFTRQLVVDRYIVDIACRSLKIAIEVDGGHHASQVDEDADRTAYLQAQGWTVLRFWNNEVLDQLEAVVDAISQAASQASTHPQPLPLREGSE